MSHASSDGYERLLDFAEEAGNMQRDAVYQPIQHPPHTGLTIHPPPAPGSSTSTGGVGSSSTHTSRTKGSKTKAPKKSRRMAWLLIHNTGETQTLHLDKRMLVQVLGLEIPMRDLRLMDPALAAFDSQFAQILVRDNALVVSAEHVRIIITCDKVIFPLDFEKTEASQRFMKTMEGIIRERPDCPSYAAAAGATAVPSTASSPQPAQQPQTQPQLQTVHSGHAQQQLFGSQLQHAGSMRLHRGGAATGAHYGRTDPDLLPFELNMLEAALGEITRHYVQQTSTLESLAHPALDSLMRQCNSTNLERVRKIKTQHQRLMGRLQGLREVLERYTEDDQDMYRMCLSKIRDQDLEGADAGSDNTMLIGRREMYAGGLSMPDLQAAGTAAAAATGSHAAIGSFSRRAPLSSYTRGSPPGYMERFQGLSRRERAGGSSSSSSSSSSGSSADQHDLLEVENLLESYLMMVDGTLAKLAGIGEYIDDTEDYINIELDYNRNRLLRIEILLTVATFSLAIYNLVAGILGENLVLPSAWTADIRGFIAINATTLSVCATVFVVTWHVMSKKKLI